jgi:hypothetical protein
VLGKRKQATRTRFGSGVAAQLQRLAGPNAAPSEGGDHHEA